MRSYKGLEQVERAFKTFKGPELEIRPIHHRLEDRVRAHVFLCMLAYYLTWHLRHAWAPLLFNDETPPTPSDPVAKATRSPAAKRKAATKRTTTGEPCPQLQEPARRARDPDPQHDPPPRHRRDLPQAHRAHPHPGTRAHSPTTPPSSRSHDPSTPNRAQNPNNHAPFLHPITRNFGLNVGVFEWRGRSGGPGRGLWCASELAIELPLLFNLILGVSRTGFRGDCFRWVPWSFGR